MKIDMTEYVAKILDEMPEDMDGTATSPAADHLFQIIDGIELLDEANSDFFHATVAKLLFLCKQGRPDIQTAIAFLCTRVQQPTKHDYNKLARVIKYLRQTDALDPVSSSPPTMPTTYPVYVSVSAVALKSQE